MYWWYGKKSYSLSQPNGYWVRWVGRFSTAKRLSRIAQGRKAHPGKQKKPDVSGNSEGVLQKVLMTFGQPLRGWVGFIILSNPECASRPWAILDNRFAVENVLPKSSPKEQSSYSNSSHIENGRVRKYHYSRKLSIVIPVPQTMFSPRFFAS